ncbi:MAG: hypothetical protein VW397_05560 [Candidatus Margulisiibacteriota bacterium]
MKILLLTCHLFKSKNKAGFHHLAHALNTNGHHVHFCTCPNSILNLIQEIKTDSTRFYERLKTFFHSFFYASNEGIISGGYFSIIHNYANLTVAQSLVKFFFLKGFSTLFSPSRGYDIIIFESNVSLYLFETLKKRFPSAKFVYRISDVLSLIGASQDLIAHETNLLDKFDLLIVPNLSMHEMFTRLTKNKILIQHHGVNTKQYDQALTSPSPFTHFKRHAVYIGMSKFDWDFIRISSQLFPEIQFHIIGPYPQKISAPNIKYHGLLTFENTLTYLAHCNFGLNIGIYPNETDENFIKANKPLKYIQYTYFKKPMVSPSRLSLNEPHVFSYELNNKSIQNAICSAMNHTFVSNEIIKDWTDLSKEIISNL